MKTYRKLTLSLSLLVLAALVGATQAQAFTPGYMQKEEEDKYTPYQCKVTPLSTLAEASVSAQSWSPPGKPSSVSFSPASPVVGSGLSVPFGSTTVPGGGYINNTPEMRALREAVGNAKELKANGYTYSYQKSSLLAKLSSRKSSAISETKDIKQAEVRAAKKKAAKAFADQNQGLYNDYKSSVSSIQASANSELSDAYGTNWGPDSANKARHDALVSNLERIDREQRKAKADQQLVITKGCEEAKKIDRVRDEDVYEVEADRSAAVDLEKKKLADIAVAIQTEKNTALQKASVDYNTNLETIQAATADQIVEIIETKEGQKVEANNTARNQIIENTIAAEDAIAEARTLTDDANKEARSSAEDAAAELTLATEEEVSSLREGITSRVEEVQSQFVDRKSQAAESYRGNMRAIRSRWSGKINENRTKANQARRVLRKQAGANWSNGNRQQLLQDQRRAGAQLAAALKGLRYAKTTRDKQFSKEKVRYQKQLSAISKQERQQKLVIQGPVEQKVQQLQAKLKAEVALINQKRDTAIAENENKFNAEKSKVETRINQQNAIIVSDLATVLATLDRQKNQESSKVQKTADLEIKKLDRALVTTENEILTTASSKEREAQAASEVAIKTIDQAAKKETQTINRTADTSIDGVETKTEDSVKTLEDKVETLRGDAVTANNTYKQETATANGAWRTEVARITSTSSQKAQDLYSGEGGYKTQASAALTTAKNSVTTATNTAEQRRKTNADEVSKVYDEGRSAASAAKKK